MVRRRSPLSPSAATLTRVVGNRGTRTSESRLPRMTICCPDCDVTWRGSTSDPCWSCGAVGHAERAVAPQVRVS